jgi:endonuclease-3 related protein
VGQAPPYQRTAYGLWAKGCYTDTRRGKEFYPIFVVDAYTARIVFRHGLIGPDADYEQLRELFESSLPADTELFNEYHALLVRAGKEFCRPKARCSHCPLEKLPHTLDVEYL